MSISVIIRTRNSAAQLKRNIVFLKRQTVKPVEIIVVDSGSTDYTKLIAEDAGCRFIDYSKDSAVFNYSKALNIGIRSSIGRFVLIVSSHVWLQDPNTLHWMKDFLLNDDCIKAVSMARDTNPDENNTKREDLDWEIINKDYFKGAAMYNYCSMIRRNDWCEYVFNEHIPTCEDQEWMLYWFAKQKENKSVIIYKPVVGYNNPNYNLKKDIQEFYISGKYIYPYYRSFSFIISLYKKAFSCFFNKKVGKAKYNLKLATALLFYKIIPPSTINSDDFMSKG